MHVLRLAIPSPLRSLFDYLPPADLAPDMVAGLQPGQRLLVPFGSRQVTGYLMAVVPAQEAGGRSLKAALRLLDPAPLLPETLWQLCQWAADYYQHPPGEVLPAAFPKRLREGEPHRTLAEPGWRLTTRGRGLPEGALARAPRQAEALALLQQAPALSRRALSNANISSAVLRQLVARELVESCTISDHLQTPKALPALDPSEEQSRVLAAVANAGTGFSCHLLEGVTGSGKTEVYLQLIAQCLQRERQALVLIPEIGLTPQTLARFQQRFDAEIAVLHSGLTDAQRYQAWEAARSGRAAVVIGTRSAVFTPLARPGLVVVDEEHDASYKQQDGFRYSARDVAVKRGQLEQCPVLLGSATPSLESLDNALAGRYHHHRLHQRAGHGTLPAILLQDVRHQPLEGGLSEQARAAMAEALAAGRQCLLFVNRRGFAPTLRCHDCGWIADCRHCDARLTLHRRQRRLRCHHCGAADPLPPRCPDCNSDQLLTTGLGTEQVEDHLQRLFPQTPVYRVDSDSMGGRDAMAELGEQVNAGAPCILVGTQMLAKGHHFPGVSLVVVLDMDALLFSTDFRGEERAAQLLTQVAGRAGREDDRGRVLLQTHHPEHPLLLAAAKGDYHQQAMALLAQRQQAGLPPAGRLALLRSDCTDAEAGERFLRTLRTGTEAALPRGVRLIGPLPAPMQRRAGRFRSQLLVQANSRASLHQAVRALVAAAREQGASRNLNWSVDIDPLDMA